MEILTFEIPAWLALMVAVVGYVMGAVIQYGIDKDKER